VTAPDLTAVAACAESAGLAVALVEQPYRVAGRRSPAPAHALDAAWIAVVERLRRGELAGLPLIVGGRSAGARVACRTAEVTGAIGVLCLAFPLQPPSRTGGKPAESRLAELDAVTLPMLVIQGEHDRFGIPPDAPRRTVVRVASDHGLKSDLERVAAAAGAWLSDLLRDPSAEKEGFEPSRQGFPHLTP
jgi:predicted alpha/beta-hydrolase family hydrolase